MEYETIRKPPTPAVLPYLLDYAGARAAFDWDAAAAELDWLPGGKINIAHEAVDRHASDHDRVAIRWIAKDLSTRDLTYWMLADATSSFASGLQDLGVEPGDMVFALCPRLPEFYVAALGTLKRGAILSPLFAAFGPEPIATRMNLGRGRALVTTERLYRRKIEAIRDELPHLEYVIVIDGGSIEDIPGGVAYSSLVESGNPTTPPRPMDPEEPALVHFTSGTTGTPKGAVHVHGAVVHHDVSARLALDLHPDDVFWCTADPGWVTGTSYGIIAPLVRGVTNVVDAGDFDPDRWYRIIEDHRVTVWYTAPTAIRMLMKAGAGIAKEYDLSSLRFIASVGEPLNPEAVVWGSETFGLPIHDNWWQTETGGIMIANFAGCDIRPGSMGRPLPGIEATILRRDERGGIALDADGIPIEESEPFTEGELAVRAGWPSMFRGYLEMEDRYRSCFVDGWYRSGDLAERDGDGYFWFVGRADDVIKSAGHLIGPFEVESALVEHPAVAEAGVIGVPDDVAGEVVKAFVSLNPAYEWSHELERELMAWSRTRLGAAVAPRTIAYEASLPHTRSGKIMRRLLKAWELGLPTGDLSTLEEGGAP